MSKHLYNVPCTGAQDTCSVHATINAKNAHTPAQAHPCDGAATSWPWKSFRPMCSTGALPKKPTESTPAHGAVAAVLSHRHHLIIRFGAGPVQFVYGLYSKLGHGAYPSQNSISTIVFAGFFIFLCNFLLWPAIWNYYLVILAWFRWDEKNSKNLMIFWWRSVLHHSKILHF